MKLVSENKKINYRIQRISFYNGTKLTGFIEIPEMTSEPEENVFVVDPFGILIRLKYFEDKQPEFEVIDFLTS